MADNKSNTRSDEIKQSIDIWKANPNLPESRKRAKELGMRHFFTGKPCKFGHIAKRNTISGRCSVCDVEYQRTWLDRHPEDRPKRNEQIQYRRRLITSERDKGKPECCELCGHVSLKLVFDHCHESDVFRGWICYKCNNLLSNARDSVEILEKAIEYLKRDMRLRPKISRHLGRLVLDTGKQEDVDHE